MIDIETADTGTAAHVLSIGAVTFNAKTGEMGDPFYFRLDDTDQQYRTISMDTIRWWMQQSREAQQDAWVGETIPATKALSILQPYVVTADRVWARGPSFDLAIINSLAKDCMPVGEEEYYEQKPREYIPWYKWRDERVLRDILGGRAPHRTGTHHNAKDDAVHQARIVIAGYALGAGE